MRDRYDLGQKTVLAEIMWGLVLADGQIAESATYPMFSKPSWRTATRLSGGAYIGVGAFRYDW